MAPTRAEVETVLVARRGPLMTIAGMLTTSGGTNADLNDPIAYGIRQSSGTVASVVVADADIATVSDVDSLLDIAELRLLRTIKGRYDRVDIRSGPFSQEFSQLITSLKDDIKDLEQLVADLYGVGGVNVDTGNITMDFASHGDEENEVIA